MRARLALVLALVRRGEHALGFELRELDLSPTRNVGSRGAPRARGPFPRRAASFRRRARAQIVDLGEKAKAVGGGSSHASSVEEGYPFMVASSDAAVVLLHIIPAGSPSM